MHGRLAVVTLTGLAALALPAVGHAATKEVTMGVAPKDAFPRSSQADANRFYPSQITIAAGDSVRFAPYGFHTVDLPRRGGRPLPFLAPSGTAKGLADAAGAPFWFNGMDLFGFNPALLKGSLGKTVAYTGARTVQSGLPLAARPKPMTVRFPKAGRFSYVCDIHPGMKGSVTVRAKGATVPSARADAARVARQVRADKATAKRLLAAKPAARTIGLGASDGAVEVLAMLPGTLKVKVGESVRFAMPTRSSEVHSAIAGPGDPEAKTAAGLGYVGQITKSFENDPVLDARGTYASEAPGAPSVLSRTVHGNGFWTSGLLDGSPLLPFRGSRSVTMTEAGTFTFYCVIHPFMQAKVTAE